MKTEKKQKTPVMAAAVDNAVEENQLLSCLNSASKPLSLAELAAQIKGNSGNLESLLQQMETRGQVIRTRKNRYGIPEKMNLYVGTIQGHPKGYAFFIPDIKKDDFFISKENMGGAMHNDRVVVRPLGFSLRGKRMEGEVIRV
jgi:ribonuclease R